MSTWKMNKMDDSDKLAKEQVKASADVGNPPAAPADVEVLEIDVEAEVDCDPYNRTGQFCVPVFDKRDS
ncbi:MAG: hypothetical protein QNJ07_06370 [Woeseiaceae bacterium]|nr:hypothetical protein [Woeseiaceae bacterium]